MHSKNRHRRYRARGLAVGVAAIGHYGPQVSSPLFRRTRPTATVVTNVAEATGGNSKNKQQFGLQFCALASTFRGVVSGMFGTRRLDALDQNCELPTVPPSTTQARKSTRHHHRFGEVAS